MTLLPLLMLNMPIIIIAFRNPNPTHDNTFIIRSPPFINFSVCICIILVQLQYDIFELKFIAFVRFRSNSTVSLLSLTECRFAISSK